MKRILTIFLALALVFAIVATTAPTLAVQEEYVSEGDVYVVSDDTDFIVIGPPIAAPEPPKPIAAPIPPEPVPPEEDHTPPGTTPRPEYYPMPDAAWRPKPEPIIMGAPLPEPTPPAWEPPEEEPISWCNPPEEEEPIVITVDEDGTIIIAVERVLPCPPEPIKDPSKGIQIEPNDDVGPGPDGNVGFSRPIAPEPTPPPWEPEEEPDDDIFVAALPPKEDVDRGCIIYCTLDVDTISISVESINDIDPKLFVCDTISCRAEVLEPTKAHGYFEVERPRGTRLFLAVFDSEGVMFHITVWTPPLP